MLDAPVPPREPDSQDDKRQRDRDSDSGNSQPGLRSSAFAVSTLLTVEPVQFGYAKLLGAVLKWTVAEEGHAEEGLCVCA